MQIDANFECGNIIVESQTETEATLSIRPDSNAKYYQWFYFRVSGDPGVIRTFHLSNAGNASYPKAWPGYRALASYDDKSWFRVHTQYDGQNLTIKHKASQAHVSYAFFVPYTEAMRTRLLDTASASPLVERRRVITTPGGRPLDMLVIGKASAQRHVWLISRQHAGEPMAEYMLEGMIHQLLDPNDSVAKSLLEKGIAFYCIPNMNPDGSALGNLRANAAGVDLNRAWENPGEDAPEVASVRALMDAEGCDFFLDLHGDEDRPYLWLVQPLPENCFPELAPAQERFEAEVRARYASYGPYPGDGGGPGSKGMSLDYVAQRFRCPAFIVELPFKDVIGNDGNGDSLLGEGCAEFGRSCLEIINAMM